MEKCPVEGDRGDPKLEKLILRNGEAKFLSPTQGRRKVHTTGPRLKVAEGARVRC